MALPQASELASYDDFWRAVGGSTYDEWLAYRASVGEGSDMVQSQGLATDQRAGEPRMEARDTLDRCPNLAT